MAELMTDIRNQTDYLKYTRDVAHKHSPAVGRLLDLYENYIQTVEKNAREGRKQAVWTVGISESPLIYALDAVPLAFTELGRLGTGNAISVAEDYFQIPRECCSMVKAILGEFYLRKDITVKNILYMGTTCEPIKMAYDVIEPYGYNVHTLDCGYNMKVDSEERYENMIRNFIREMQETAIWLTGKPVDEKRLGEELKGYNRRMRKAAEFMELKKEHPGYVNSLATVFILMGSPYCFGMPREYEAALDALIEEMKGLDEGEFKENVVPLIWSGGRGQEFGVYQAIDEAGGAILGWTSAPQIRFLYDESKPPIRAFAEFQMSAAVSSSTEGIFPLMEKEVAHSGAKGIFHYGFMGCSFGGIEGGLRRRHFQQKGIPVMEIFGTFQVGPPSGQLITRVKAFIEMLS